MRNKELQNPYNLIEKVVADMRCTAQGVVPRLLRLGFLRQLQTGPGSLIYVMEKEGQE